MTRMSAGSVKRGYRLKVRPAPGTKTGRVYDLFRERPAQIVTSREIFELTGHTTSAGEWGYMLGYLIDYGLDVRRHSRGKYWLVGEYEGSRYVDHVAAKVA